MNIPLFIGLLFALQILCLIVGSRSSKKMQDKTDYYLAGKGISFFPLMMTFIATQVGGGLILGSAEEAYKYGWTVLFYPLGATLGLILLACGIGKKMTQFKVSTVAQIFEVVYGSATLKKIASILSIISLFMVFIAQVIASKKFMLGLGVNSEAIFIGFWTIVIIYTAIGGLKAVVATDVVQALFFIGIFFLCIGFVFISGSISWEQATQIGSSFDYSLGKDKFVGWLLMPLLFMVIEQDMGQRCFAAASGRTVSLATAGAAICTLSVCTIPVFMGVMGKGLGVEIPPGSSVLMAIINQVTNPILASLVACAILAAIISTADSLINAISSNWAQDFVTTKKNEGIRSARWITTSIAVLGLFSSYFFNSIVDVLIQSYELSVSCLFVPVIFALFRRKGHVLSATLSIVMGAAGFVLFKIYPIEFPREIVSILMSLAGFGIGEAVAYNRVKNQAPAVDL